MAVARRVLIALCSDKRGISIPLRKTIEAAEVLIAEAIAAARCSPATNTKEAA